MLLCKAFSAAILSGVWCPVLEKLSTGNRFYITLISKFHDLRFASPEILTICGRVGQHMARTLVTEILALLELGDHIV